MPQSTFSPRAAGGYTRKLQGLRERPWNLESGLLGWKVQFNHLVDEWHKYLANMVRCLFDIYFSLPPSPQNLEFVQEHTCSPWCPDIPGTEMNVKVNSMFLLFPLPMMGSGLPTWPIWTNEKQGKVCWGFGPSSSSLFQVSAQSDPLLFSGYVRMYKGEACLCSTASVRRRSVQTYLQR